MAIDFPNSPSLNETFTSGTRTWKWDGSVWELQNYGAQGPQGAQGITGAQGFQGTPFVVTVGSSLGTSGSIDLDMSQLDNTYQMITLTGNPTFTTSNRAAGRTITIRLAAGGSSRNLAFPAWVFLSGTPTTLAANKVGVLSVTFFDTTNENAVAAWAAQL